MVNSEYRKRQDGNKVIFDVKPASCPRNKSVLYIAAPIMLFIAIGLLMSGIVGIIFLILVIAPIAYLAFYKDWRPVAHRAPSTFSVTSVEIECNGGTFKKEDIHRLLIRNGMSKDEVALAYVASGRGSASFAVGQQYKAKIAAVTNSLDLETGGNAYTLAGGMSETTAFGLMTDVGRVLGIQSA